MHMLGCVGNSNNLILIFFFLFVKSWCNLPTDIIEKEHLCIFNVASRFSCTVLPNNSGFADNITGII